MANSPIKLFGPDSQFSQWQAYTPTFSPGFGVVTSINFKWCRYGNTLKIIGQFVSGTMTNDTYSFSLPASLLISSTIQAGDLLGQVTADQPLSELLYLGGSPLQTGPNFYVQQLAGAYTLVTTTGPLPNAGSRYFLEVDVPIDG